MFGYNLPDDFSRPFHRPCEGEIPVKQNQSVTPAQIADLTAHGMAVSSYNNLVFDEGSPNPPSLPLEQQRGVDVAEVWNASKTASKKLKCVIKASSVSSSN